MKSALPRAAIRYGRERSREPARLRGGAGRKPPHRFGRAALALAAALLGTSAPAEVTVVGNRIEQPIAGPGDARRGRALAFERESACILCHQLPADEAGSQPGAGGSLGPPLLATGARMDAAQLRLRLVDSSRLNPRTIMPSYYRTEGLRDVAPAYAGRTILTAQQIEDIVAWLSALK